MKVLIPGHNYQLDNLENDGSPEQTIHFIRKEEDLNDVGRIELKTVQQGTTNEEVLLMLIDRLTYLNNEHQGGKFKCKENACAITHLEEALHWLESRTKKRVARGVEGKHIV